MRPATVEPASQSEDAPAGRGFDAAALGALFGLTLRQHTRGRRLLILSLLFLLPSALGAVFRLTMTEPPAPAQLEFNLILGFISQALAPLAALLYAAGIVQDEVEEQTLTYLLLRPLPRWALYVTKLAATWVVTASLTAAFAALSYAVIYWGTPELWGDILPRRAAKTAGLFALAQLGYCSLFGFVGLLTRRSLVIGIGYIVAVEGMLAYFQTVARFLTVTYYFRVLATRWLDLHGKRSWDMDLATAPDSADCVWTLLAASAVLAAIGAVLMARREFRVKTPEGS